MSYCTSDILLLAGQIYTGVNSPSNLSIGYLSGWLMSAENVGELNNRLSTSLSISGACILDMGPEEATIYGSIYSMDYYEQQSLAALAGGGSYWESLSEGDSKVSRTSVVNISKAYLALHDNAEKALYVSIAQYKRRVSIPATVDGTDLPAWPSP